MRAAAIVMGLALAAGMGAAPAMEAQVRAADLVTAARAQLRTGNVDSGLVLVGLALDSSTMATGRDRVNALVWRGVLQYFKGRDSLAHESFRDALSMDPRLEVAGLAQIDTLYSCIPECRGLDQPPRPLPGESDVVTLRSGSAGSIMGGVAVVRFVVDSMGGVEPASITVVSSPSPALRDTLVDHVRQARFSPGRVQGRAARVLVQWRLTLRSR